MIVLGQTTCAAESNTFKSWRIAQGKHQCSRKKIAMPNDDLDNTDEDWYDDDVETEEETGRCPECGGPVYEFVDRCSGCGRWLTAADRRRLWRGESKPKWVLLTALVILAVLVVGSLALYF